MVERSARVGEARLPEPALDAPRTGPVGVERHDLGGGVAKRRRHPVDDCLEILLDVAVGVDDCGHAA